MDIETAVATPRSNVAVTVRARDVEAIQDKPVEFGGNNEGMMASEHLLVALLGCQHSTMVKVATKRKVDVQIHAITGNLHLENDAIQHIDVVHELSSDASDDELTRVVKLTDRVCTISKALACPVQCSFIRA